MTLDCLKNHSRSHFLIFILFVILVAPNADMFQIREVTGQKFGTVDPTAPADSLGGRRGKTGRVKMTDVLLCDLNSHFFVLGLLPDIESLKHFCN